MDSKKDIFATSKGKWDFTIALLVIAAFSIFIYQFLFTTSDEIAVNTTPEPENSQITPALLNIPDEEKEYLYSNSNTYQPITIKAEDAYNNDVTTAVVISDLKKRIPTAIDSTSTAITTETAPIADTQKKVADSITPVVLKVKEQVQEKVIAPETNTVKSTEASKIVSQTTETTLDCIVVVGVFRDVGNRTAVIDKLKSLGYSYSDGILRDGMSYVGVPVACDQTQKKQVLLSELNQAFGIDSWVKKI